MMMLKFTLMETRVFPSFRSLPFFTSGLILEQIFCWHGRLLVYSLRRAAAEAEASIAIVVPGGGGG